jgi:NADH-quinone oxidoreductase subunit M
MVGGVVAWIVGERNPNATKWTAVIVLTVDLLLLLNTWINHVTIDRWIDRYEAPWIPEFGISFSMAMDGLSFLMLVLTFFLGILAVLTSWNEINYRIGFYYFNLLWVIAGIAGVFLTMDLFLFYFFWEVMLIPMYFLIGIWGHEKRRYAAIKFFIFTQVSGLFMLLAILGLYFLHASQTGTYSFSYFDFLQTSIPLASARWIMFGFLAAFVVKLPMFPFHSWLPDAHGEAPTAGSLILAGLLLKTGAYGIIRFVVPLFPEAAVEIAPWAMLLGVVGILYGASLAFAQTDIKRLVAYTSVSHMGFIMLGIFAFNETAMQGVVMQMIAHGISTGALFIIAGMIYERIHTRDISKMGGFWSNVPYLGTIAMLFTMASLGLPGLGNFVAEFLTLVGAWSAHRLYTILATVGLVAATAYSLRIMQKIFLGEYGNKSYHLPDLSIREKLILVPMSIIIVLIGFFPQRVLNVSNDTVKSVLTKYRIEIGAMMHEAEDETKGGVHE